MSEFLNMTEQQRNCIPDVHFDLIPIRNLVSNQNYQRPISDTHISTTVEAFDIYQINPVKVSRRDGINYVFDGQHTIEIIAEKSGSRDTPVWCMVYDDLEYQEEAHIFAEQKKHVKALIPYEVFKAHVEAGDNKQTMISDLVASYGLKITKTFAPGCICAVSALEFIYDRYGYDTLNRTLRLVLGTWEGDKQSLTSGILKGIACLVSVYGDSLDDEIFKDHVGKDSAKKIMRTAKDHRPGTLGYAEAMIVSYNMKNKRCLSMKKLYWKKGNEALEEMEEIAEDTAEEAAVM